MARRSVVGIERAKMRAAWTPERRRAQAERARAIGLAFGWKGAAANRGKTHSVETKRRIAAGFAAARRASAKKAGGDAK